MTNKNEPAFPNEGFNGWGEPFKGMTLRDYFAAKAMQSVIDQQDVFRGEVDNTAWLAYRIADAMMKAREA